LFLQAKAAHRSGVAYLSVAESGNNLQTADRNDVLASEELLRMDDELRKRVEAAKGRRNIFEVRVDLGPTGLLGGGSVRDVREAVRAEVVRVLQDEGRYDLVE